MSETHQRTSSFASSVRTAGGLSDPSGSDHEMEESPVSNAHSQFLNPQNNAFAQANSSSNRPSEQFRISSPADYGSQDPPFSKIRAGIALLLWYTFGIMLSVYNKHMFSDQGMNFKFPIITTSLHQLAQILLSLCAIYILHLPTINLSKGGRLKIIPASLASASDIGLGNTSLLLVTLSFYTMLKSSALGFVLLFSVLFKLEAPTLKLVAILSVMTFGVFLMAVGEADFNLLGFFLVLGASCSSGLRWALVKLLLNGGNKSEESESTHAQEDSSKKWKKPHPVQTILLLSPGMFVGLFIIGCLVEGPRNFATADLWQKWSVARGIVTLLFPGVLAFCMTWAEFDLLNTTGPLALAIGGICKEVATIIMSVIIFKDRLSVVNSIGLIVTILSIGMYHYHRNME